MTVLPEKSRIALQVRMSFAALMPRRRWLNGHLVLARQVDSDRFLSVQTFSPRNVLHTFRLHGPDEVDAEFTGWLAEAYRVGEQRHLERPLEGRLPLRHGTSVARWVSPGPSSRRSGTPSVPDLIGPGLRLLFVGINPGLWTAAVQTHFARPGNRFYPALRRAGILTRDIDLARGMTDDDRRHLLDRGIGITNLVNRATARADELTAAELRERRPAADRAGPHLAAPGGRRPGRQRLPRRLRQAQGPGRRTARAPRGRTALGRPQPERPERPRHGRVASRPRTPPPPTRPACSGEPRTLVGHAGSQRAG